LARTFVCELPIVLGQDGTVDAARKAGKHGRLRGEGVAEIGERHTGRLADIADRYVLETPLPRELHQRIDDFAARVGRRRLGLAFRFRRHSALLKITFQTMYALRRRPPTPAIDTPAIPPFRPPARGLRPPPES